MSIFAKRRNLSIWIIAALAGYLASGESRADSIPTTDPLYYAGTLMDDGVPVEGVRNIEVGFFDDALASDTPLCVTDAQSTNVVNGRFRISLNAACLEVVRAQPDVWVQLKVDGASLGISKLGAVPYAVEAERAARAPGAVGLGSVIAHMPHMAGAASVAEMQALGFAVADGTTPSSQGISGAVITAATPDLNGQGLFLRGGAAADSGMLQDDATARNGLTLAFNDPGHNHAQNAHNHTQNAHNHSQDPHSHSSPSHRHASRVSDTTGFCNNNNSDVPRMGNTANWDHASTSDQGCGYWTSSTAVSINSTTASNNSTTAVNNATTAVNQSNSTGITSNLGAGDSETRPANMSVVWMIRVR